jgi:macrolide transport system ATP-binding/permease protein
MPGELLFAWIGPLMSASQPTSLSPLVARDLSKAYGDRVVLDGVDLVVPPGLPVGLVGENGAGKSTLLRLLAGVDRADAGQVTRPDDLAYLAQDPAFGDRATVAGVLQEALAPLHDLVARLESLAARLDDEEAATDYSRLLEWAVLHDAWGADRRAAEAADRLGLGSLPRDQEVAALSGGQRSRLALAALVARRPTCVLLDEPTNHLDDGAMEFVESFLVDLPGVVLVASHDRTFLDNVCAQVVDLDPSHFGTDGEGGNRFTGGYSAYLEAKRKARARWEQAFADQREELTALRDAAKGSARQVAHDRPARDNDKFIYYGKGQKVARTVSRRVRDTERRIEVLERNQVPKPPKPLALRVAVAPAVAHGRVVQVRDLVVEGRVRVPLLDVAGGEHLLVTGANGSGKSTLLKVLAGRVPPTSGSVAVGARRVGFLPQDVTFRHPERTPHQVYDGLTGSPIPLGDLGLLHPRDLARPVGALSLGQQRRLALAVLVAERPDLLLLDEPTNHISLALAEELEESLRRSPGSVVVASHDRWLRRGWDGPTLALTPDVP